MEKHDGCWNNSSDVLTPEQLRWCLTKQVGQYHQLNTVSSNMAQEFSLKFPNFNSGIVDSCDGYNFPECPNWYIDPSGKSYKYSVFVKYDEPLANDAAPDEIYTTIAGIRTTNDNLTESGRSLECRVSVSNQTGFVIDMISKAEFYETA